MGLDSVELIMAVEEVFDIEIPDTEAERLVTVGDIYWLALAKLDLVPQAGIEAAASASGRARQTWTVQTVWVALRSAIVEQLEVPPEKVTLTARIVDDLGAD